MKFNFKVFIENSAVTLVRLRLMFVPQQVDLSAKFSLLLRKWLVI